ncbi:MAG TPA: lipase maturation factor family protein [Polyangiaceae bacterium]
MPDEGAAAFRPPLAGTEYFLTRAVFLRALGFLYVVAFAILVRQVVPLVGEHGLLPVRPFLERVSEHYEGMPAAALRHPTLFWLGASDAALLVAAWIGLLLGVLVLAGLANLPLLFALWALYLSFCHVGQVFYGYGWDILLCEAGFLAMFLAPPLRPRPLSASELPPFVVIVLYRWLAFRLMFGAGMIKVRGDPCWLELRCLDFHYETQPIPGPLSAYFHFAPAFTHALGVAFNHFAELVAPFGVFGPRRVRILAGCVIVLFQSLLILSGNLSFLNWLTILVALPCFDDGVFARLAPRALRVRLAALRASARPASTARKRSLVVLAVVIGLLSLNPVVNLLSPRQAMNASFDPFELVNTYGAFGSVGRVRREVVLEGTADDAENPAARWVEYEFPCKPGDVRRRPCLITPYHHRLDWQLWFAALSNFQREPWIVHLAYLLLQGEPSVKALIAKDPFPERPPRFVRARLYRYEFAPLSARGEHWRRQLEDEYLLPLSLSHQELRRFLEAYGWGD